ncbi:MAG: DUF1501 domain-containing protein [Verrucomicrobia bacterium]|nr:DUF1501 domain-containing protein [Verrucomicrobiota bacterium]
MRYPSPVQLQSRRELLKTAACGFGSLALAGLCDQGRAAAVSSTLAQKRPMFAPRAKRVIFIFMAGGPSHVDSYDFKQELIKNHDKDVDFTGVRFGTFGKKSKRRLMKPLWNFKQYGQCGQPVSELFPHTAQFVDDLCFIKSMQTEGVAHGPSTLFMHTGATNLVRPSVGSWVTYGLGTENQNLPGFVTLQPSASKGGPRNYANAFLPAIHQGTAIGKAGQPADEATLRNALNSVTPLSEQERNFRFLQKINRAQLASRPQDDPLDAIVESYELAWRMQMNAPEVFDISGEPESVRERYGIGTKESDDFGKQCLIGRRLAEAGVRFIQLNYADESANPRWDQHSNMPLHMNHARATDKPVAGLLADLKERGLLEETLVWWGGEFGRTPFSQSGDGRDHNPRGFTTWLAGAGVRPGFSYGSTDEIGDTAVENPVHMHDLHATILHILGMDHEKLTHRHAGRDFRLTDVHGSVVHGILS